jgi:lipopolysaccharide transport system ATP-binding protein
MTETVISTESLSKSYLIGHQRNEPYLTLRDSMMHTALGLWQRVRHPLSPNLEETELEEFWALRDINLEIKQGERVGVIGRNGAGKSTLLKILSRITDPTTGQVCIRGRMAALLEVGTGFHRELTGRENIYLNGAILGMTRQEIKNKFDEIVAFAEVEKFLDTPIKRYSSGMHVRLAFSVSAHLEPDILLVDEVLAVGDAEFQKKCMGKMDEVAEGGRTVLFVSHNMAAVSNLCEKSIVLKDGQMTFSGPTREAIAHYRETNNSSDNKFNLLDIKRRKRTSGFSFVRYAIESDAGENIDYAISGEKLKIVLFFKGLEQIKNVNVGIAIFTNEGVRLSSLATSLINKNFSSIPKEGKFIFEIPKLPLNEGSYSVLIDANMSGTVLDRVEDAFILNVEKGDFWGTGKISKPNNPLLLDFDVNVKEI